MNRHAVCSAILALVSVMLIGCSKGDRARSGSERNETSNSGAAKNQLPAQSDSYYVLDKGQKIIYGIDLKSNKVSQRFALTEEVVTIAYDGAKDWIYEAVGGNRPGLRVFDPKTSRVVKSFDFVQPPSDMLFNPVKRELYIVSEDSTYIHFFSPDSLTFTRKYPLWVAGAKPVGPRTLSPGPAGRLYTANGARGSVTTMLTDQNYAYQTIIISGAKFIDNAVSSFDGNSALCCDSKQGKVFRVEFGTGNMIAEKSGLDNPRLIQFEVNSQTVVLATGKSELRMLNPNTFVETGKVDLSEYGDEILTLFIPPRSNYAELTMDQKGVTRWFRFDLRTWQPMRMVELY
jgi:DNA-binding beta-propeller fold protein YncE